LGRRLNLAGPSGLPALALLTDARRLPDPLAAAARLPAGSFVILRHYGAAERDLLAQRLAVLCRARRLALLVAADFDLAVALKSGLHLPEGLVAKASVRIRLWHRRGGRWLTAAAHGRSALVRAAALRADAALLSPVFPTASHPAARPLGPVVFRRLVRQAGLPVYALGGVNAATILRLSGSGAAGVAAVSGLGG
jgi:thiamine-phosphate pyrophosphorylase